MNNTKQLTNKEVASICNDLLGTSEIANAFSEALEGNMVVTNQDKKTTGVLYEGFSRNFFTTYLLDKHSLVQGRKASDLKKIIIFLKNGEKINFIRIDEKSDSPWIKM